MLYASQHSVSQNIQTILAQIAHAEKKYGRQAGSVQLLAVSKTRPIEDIYAALEAQQYQFGENYLQDALPKIVEISASSYSQSVEWHFIGPIQSNKTHSIAEHFNWVHSVDRFKIARRLSEQRQSEQIPLNICLQINTSGEQSKSGITPEEAVKLAKEISILTNIKLRGLMTIPAANSDFEQQRRPFQLLRELKSDIEKEGIALDTLSMGMSNDMEAAIAEGSTIVRIGTAIFGQRTN